MHKPKKEYETAYLELAPSDTAKILRPL